MPFSNVKAQKFISGGQHFTRLISGIVFSYQISYLIDVLLDVLGHGSCDNRHALPHGGPRPIVLSSINVVVATWLPVAASALA